MLPRTIAWVKEASLEVRDVTGTGHFLPFPRAPPVGFELFDQARTITKWVALHSLVVATK